MKDTIASVVWCSMAYDLTVLEAPCCAWRVRKPRKGLGVRWPPFLPVAPEPPAGVSQANDNNKKSALTEFSGLEDGNA